MGRDQRGSTVDHIRLKTTMVEKALTREERTEFPDLQMRLALSGPAHISTEVRACAQCF